MDISVKYGSTNSKYCYLGTAILINKLEIQNEIHLKEAETLFSAQRLLELTAKPILGDFALDHLKSIHHHIFQDIYPFAGMLREENISKGGTLFAQSQYIEPFAAELFSKLKLEGLLVGLDSSAFSDRAAHYMAEINAIHPFREGNGRAIREYIRSLALYCGYTLNWDSIDKDEILEASIESIKNYEHLANCILRCIDT